MGKKAAMARQGLVKRLVKASKRLYLADIAEPPVWESEFWNRVDEVIEAAIDLDNARLVGRGSLGD